MTKLKISTKEKEICRRAYPMIESYLSRHGGIAKREDIEKVIGKIPIAFAIEEKKIKPIVIVQQSKKYPSLNDKINCVCLFSWSGARPAWLE